MTGTKCSFSDIDADRAEWRLFGQRHDIGRLGRRQVKLTQSEAKQPGFRANGSEACRTRRAGHGRNVSQR